MGGCCAIHPLINGESVDGIDGRSSFQDLYLLNVSSTTNVNLFLGILFCKSFYRGTDQDMRTLRFLSTYVIGLGEANQ